MPDIHVPDLDDARDAERLSQSAASRRSRSYSSALKIALEVVLISTGVFLGLMGEQWREHKAHRELAQEALRRFRTEIATNRASVSAVLEYHVRTRKTIALHFGRPAKSRTLTDVHIEGIQPAFFKRTAWELALATQSLSYVDAELAYGLSDVYTLQDAYADQTRDILQAVYLQPPVIDPERFLAALSAYYGDIVLWEPRLLEQYDELRPKLDHAIDAK